MTREVLMAIAFAPALVVAVVAVVVLAGFVVPPAPAGAGRHRGGSHVRR